MNKEDIIRMAREAVLITQFDCTTPWVEDYDLTPHLERFAALVAAAEREACAKVCETNHGTIKRSLDGFECAAAIRARGKK